MTMVNVLRPTLVSKFKCSGEVCQDSCCAGWRIDIDKETFNKYKNIKDYRFIGMDRHISRSRSQNNRFTYGKITLQQGRCPYMTEEGLCRIQKELGEEYLSVTCDTFPRSYMNVNDMLEQSLSTTCEEVVKLLVQELDVMQFEMLEMDVELNKIYIGKTINSECLWDVREYIIDTLQDRSMKVSERLFKIVLTMNKVKDHMEQYKDILEIYKSFESAEIQALYQRVEMDRESQLDLFKDLTDFRLEKGIGNKRHIMLVKDIYSQIGYVEGQQGEIYINYSNLVDIYNEKMEDYEYVLEHILVNHVFASCTPFDFNNMMDSITYLVATYFILKNHLIGSINQSYGNTFEEHLVVVISGYSRSFSHATKYRNSLVEGLNKLGKTRLEDMILMLK